MFANSSRVTLHIPCRVDREMRWFYCSNNFPPFSTSQRLPGHQLSPLMGGIWYFLWVSPAQHVDFGWGKNPSARLRVTLVFQRCIIRTSTKAFKNTSTNIMKPNPVGAVQQVVWNFACCVVRRSTFVGLGTCRVCCWDTKGLFGHDEQTQPMAKLYLTFGC